MPIKERVAIVESKQGHWVDIYLTEVEGAPYARLQIGFKTMEGGFVWLDPAALEELAKRCAEARHMIMIKWGDDPE